MGRKTLSDTLEEQRELIFNSSKSEIAPLLSQMGIDSAYLTSGEALYNKVINLFETQKKENQEERLAYDIFYEAKNSCELEARRNYKLIRMASRNDVDLQNRIKVNQPKSGRIEDWIIQTIEFYNLVLNEQDLLKIISKYRITKQSLNKAIKDLEHLRTLRNKATAEKGQTQEATRLRNEKMEELTDYCVELKTVAKIALEGQPQLLEMLGILVRS